MGKDLDIDDVASGHPEAEKELARLRAVAAHWYEKTVQLSDALRDAERDVERWKQSRERLRSAVAMGQEFGDALDRLEQAEAENARLKLEHIVCPACGSSISREDYMTVQELIKANARLREDNNTLKEVK